MKGLIKVDRGIGGYSVHDPNTVTCERCRKREHCSKHHFSHRFGKLVISQPRGNERWTDPQGKELTPHMASVVLAMVTSYDCDTD